MGSKPAVSTLVVLGISALYAAEPSASIVNTGPNTVYSWMDKSIWDDGEVPNGENAVVSLGDPSSERLMLLIPPEAQITIDSIVSAPGDTYLRFDCGAGATNKIPRMTVRTLEGYSSLRPIGFYPDGNWVKNAAMSGFDFVGTLDNPSVVPSYYLGTLPYFNVPAADGAAVINSLHNRGTFAKTGSGRLSVVGPAGPDVGVFVEGGSFFVDSSSGSDWDLGDVVLDGDNVSVGVPAGRTARVKRVIDFKGVYDTPAGVHKTGEGTLEIDRLVPSAAPVVVAGGRVKFTARTEPAAATELPDAPEINFDASKSDSFVYIRAGSREVASWRDVRPDSGYIATNAVCGGESVECPLLTENATPTGLPAVDFKTHNITLDANKLNPRLSFEPAPVYEGFIVWKSQYDKYYKPAHFCSSEYGVFSTRMTGSQLLEYNNTEGIGRTAGMLWRIDGVTVNPMGDALGDMKGAGNAADCLWHVISFSSPVPIMLDAMAEAIDGKCGGGCLIAQLVGYSRKLTDGERRAAEACLMAKWLGKEHPDNGNFTSAITFAEGVDNVIDTDADYTPDLVTLSSPTLVKSGSGTLRLENTPSGLSAVEVECGTLELSAAADLCVDAQFHFDASRKDTLEMTANGDGTYSVTRWHDVRMNGRYADAETARCKSLPRWTDIPAPGLASGMGYVDFGPVSATNFYAEKEDSAAMNWNAAAEKVVELHLVYADNETEGTEIGSPVAFGSSSSKQCGFIRAYDKGLLHNGFSNMKCDTALDGTATAQNTLKPEGFNVVSFVVTNRFSSALEFGRLDSFCNERTLTFGGVRLAEVVVFSEAQSEERRKAIDAMLLKKWRGTGAGAEPLEIALPRVSVAAGASFKFDVDGDDGAAALSELAVEIGDGGVSGTVAVDGAFDVSVPCRVNVTVASPARLSGKEFRIIGATRLIGEAELPRWTLNVESGRPVSASLAAKEDGIYLKFAERGLILIVR